MLPSTAQLQGVNQLLRGSYLWVTYGQSMGSLYVIFGESMGNLSVWFHSHLYGYPIIDAVDNMVVNQAICMVLTHCL